MIVKLLTKRHLEFLSLKGGCRGLSESSLVKMSNCWKSRALAHFQLPLITFKLLYVHSSVAIIFRVATVREKVLENEKISRSGKSQGITFSVREIFKK